MCFHHVQVAVLYSTYLADGAPNCIVLDQRLVCELQEGNMLYRASISHNNVCVDCCVFMVDCVLLQCLCRLLCVYGRLCPVTVLSSEGSAEDTCGRLLKCNLLHM